MTTSPADSPRAAQRPGRLVVALGLVLAVVAVALGSVLDAHASSGPAVQRRDAVAASPVATGDVVAPLQRVLPGQHQARAPNDDRSAVGSRVAPQTARAAAGVADDVPLHSPNFVAHPNGEIVPVPTGAIGPTPARTGSGFQFTGGSGGHGLDPRVSGVRIMDPVTTGKYTYPNGYVSYMNEVGQTVNPWIGGTIPRSNPWAHWPWSPM